MKNYERLVQLDREESDLDSFERKLRQGSENNYNGFCGLPDTGQTVEIKVAGEIWISTLRYPYSYTEKVLVATLLTYIKAGKEAIKNERYKLTTSKIKRFINWILNSPAQ